jgi:prepilin-type N-terminal cleavage/methylation domain-containing protein
MKSILGFTLLEVITALAIVLVLSAIAAPAWMAWQKSASFKSSARGIALQLREARSRAVSSNFEHRVEFDLGNHRYRLTRGDRSSKSGSLSWKNNIVHDWTVLPPGQWLRGNGDCSLQAGTISIQINPNGTGNSRYVCLLNTSGEILLRVGTSSSTTTRVVIQRYSSSTGKWL